MSSARKEQHKYAVENLLGQNDSPKCGGTACDDMGPWHAKRQCIGTSVDVVGNSRQGVDHVHVCGTVSLEDSLDSCGAALAIEEVR
jgi:hypothetical protein